MGETLRRYWTPALLSSELAHADSDPARVRLLGEDLIAIASGRFLLNLLTTHRFGLSDVDLAIMSTGGTGLPGAIHVTVLPWHSEI